MFLFVTAELLLQVSFAVYGMWLPIRGICAAGADLKPSI